MPHFAVFLEGNHTELDMRVESPYTIRQASEEAFEHWMAGRSWLAQQIQAAPDLEALSTVVRSKRTPPAIAASLRALAEGGWPTQYSLHQGGRAVDPWCKECEQEEGTFYHRVCRCPHRERLRSSKLGLKVGFPTQASPPPHEGTHPLFWRGIPPRGDPPPTHP